MNATQFKQGERVRVQVGYKHHVHGTVAVHKAIKQWGSWKHTIEIDPQPANAPDDYYTKSLEQRIAKGQQERGDTRRLIDYESNYIIARVDENNEPIFSEAQKKAKDKQVKEHVQKMLSEQERQDNLAKAVVQCSALGMTAWQAKGKQGQYGKNKPVLVIAYEDIEKLLDVVGPAFEKEMGAMMGAHN